MTFKRLNSRKAYNTKIFELEFRDYQHTDGSVHKDLAVLNSNDAANVIAITPTNKVVLVNQFRFGIDDTTIEIPGGLVESGEDPKEAVKRELSEETGYTAEAYRYIGKVYANPVFQSNFIHHFIAYNALQSAEQSLDPAEDIDIMTMDVTEVLKRLQSGYFMHPHTVTAFNLALSHLHALIKP